MTFLPAVFLVLILLLIGVAGFFSASETVVTSVSRAQLHNRRNDVRAIVLRTLQENLGLTLSSILVGNQLISQSVTAVATWLAIEFLGESFLPITAFLFSLFIIVYVEILPKLVAIQNPVHYALSSAPLLTIFCKVLHPVTRFLESVARASLRLVGIKVLSTGHPPCSDDELRGAIDLHATGGAEEEQERLMMKSILDLNEVSIGQVMVHRKKLEMIEVCASTREMIEKILACPYSRIPLWQGNRENIVGVLHVKTLFRALQKAASNPKKNVDPVALASPPWFVPESTTLFDQLQAFRARHGHFALVVDEYGALMGAITLEDILEEIVGEIVDEHDVTATGISTQSDQSVVVEGEILIRDLNRQFNWDLPEEEAATIAGLVMHHTRKIPDIGQVCTIPGYAVEVLKRQQNRICLLRVSPQKNAQSKR
ncbi:MAG: CNNM domain-containing protein [Holosporales bacterium]|jgi:Mg2+/Co2+ transporter CorB|nr:CNNM domain-containing protein [Holosporales bacterium]